MRSLTYIFTLILASTLIVAPALGQANYKLDPAKSKIEIKGTSNLHDWEMVANNPVGAVDFHVSDLELQKINSMIFNVTTKNLESGNKIMNNKTREALDAKRHDKIKFDLIEITDLSSKGSSFSGKAKGYLSIAGKRKQVYIPFNGKVLHSNRISAKGAFSIKMTDFDVQPPTAMMGTMKTGNEVSIIFDMLWTSGT